MFCNGKWKRPLRIRANVRVIGLHMTGSKPATKQRVLEAGHKNLQVLCAHRNANADIYRSVAVMACLRAWSAKPDSEPEALSTRRAFLAT